MLSLEQIFRTQAKYGTGTSVKTVDLIPYAIYLGKLREDISRMTPSEFYSWNAKKQDSFTERLITEFVRRNSQLVEGYVDDQGEVAVEKLLDKLREDTIDSGILKYALSDPEVQEIQINDCKTIFVIKKGLAVPYCDGNGNLLQFENDEELHSAIEHLIYNPDGSAPRMTITNPIINTRTAKKGYRLSALNSSAITPDIKPGFDFPVTSVTLRKYSDSRISLEDFVEKYHSMTPKMMRFLKLCAIADVKIFFVGKTSSGKTTLMTAVLDYFIAKTMENHAKKRIICIQNPTEAMFYKRSPETLANAINVVHWEAQEVDAKLQNDPTTPTMEHLLALALRHSPDVIMPGELRLATEFEQVSKALKYDQRVMSTFHSSDANDGLNRWASELVTISGGSVMDYLYSLARSVDIVISQNRLDDGNRRVTGIEEVTGKVREGGIVETNRIAGFRFNGDVKRNTDGSIEEICGEYFDNGYISDGLLQKFYAAGISRDEVMEFIKPDTLNRG